MHKGIALVVAMMSTGCMVSHIQNPTDRITSVDAGIPGILGFSHSSASSDPAYDACLKVKGSLPGKEDLCFREVMSQSPVNRVWYCSTGWGYGQTLTYADGTPMLCNVDGPIPRRR